MSKRGTRVSTWPGPVSESPALVVDLEWDPETAKILVVGYGNGNESHAVAPGNTPSSVWGAIADSPIVEFTKEDAVMLRRSGRHAAGPIIDLQVMAWVLNENQKLSLEAVVKKYLKRDMDKRLIRKGDTVLFECDDGKLVPIKDAPLRQLRAYCKRDVDDETDLYHYLLRKLEKKGWLDYFTEEEVPLTEVLIEMELEGMPIDLVETKKLREELEEKHAKLKRLLLQGFPEVFNIGSDTQVADFLFTEEVRIKGRIPSGSEPPKGFRPIGEPKKIWQQGEWRFPGLGLPIGMRTEKGKPSVSKEALALNPSTRSNAWVKKYREWMKYDTLLTVFLRKFEDIARPGRRGEPRIYAHFNQTGTRTGRLSSSNPNMQNIPARGEWGKRVRGLFVAEPDYPFIMGDYSQLETRLMAHFSEDPFLMQIFREERDPFIELGQRVFGKTLTKEDDERNIMKNVWYAMNYGAMAEKIAEMVTMEGFPIEWDEADEIVTELQGVIPVYFEWREVLIDDVYAQGYVETLGGRHRRIKLGGATSFKVTSHGERAAANAKIQGSAMDVTRRAMIRFHRMALKLLLQVHDELIYQYIQKVSKKQRQYDVQALRDVAERGHGFDLKVPLVFEAKEALSWSEK